MKYQIIAEGDTFRVVRGDETLGRFTSPTAARVYVYTSSARFYRRLNRINALNELIYERPLTADEMEEYEQLIEQYERDREFFEHDC